MLRSYLHTAWRHLTKNKVYTSIHVAGLAIGLATALLTGLWIADEVNFDHYAPDHAHIAQIMLLQRLTSSVMGQHATPQHPQTFLGHTVAPVTGTTLEKDYRDLFPRTALVSYPNDHLIGTGVTSLSKNAVFAQAALPEMFGFRMITGSAKSLDDPSTVLLAQSTAKALFGNDNPIGKTVHVDIHTDYHVGGVYADLPGNTTFAGTDFLLPWNSPDYAWLATDNNWIDHGSRCFAELNPNTSFESATARIKNLPTPYIAKWHEELVAYPLDRAHLYDQFDSDNNAASSGGRIHDVWLFGIIGGLVLFLACINFMTLSTARGEKRAKEVRIRKTVGSLRHQLVTQFLSESLLTALLAFGLAVLLTLLALPAFNHLSAKDIAFPWTSVPFWTAATTFTFFTGLLAGSYPAFYLSAFNPIYRFTRRTGLFRKALVVTQFSVSLSLIIGTLIILRQIQYAKDRPIGYSRAGLITVAINTDTLRNHDEALRQELLRTGFVANVARSSDGTNGFESNSYMTWSGMAADKEGILYRGVTVTPEFGPTVGWTILQGRDFSRAFSADNNEEFPAVTASPGAAKSGTAISGTASNQPDTSMSLVNSAILKPRASKTRLVNW
jgi:putative ABC transport system permease protein